jgi:hypothetical protein
MNIHMKDFGQHTIIQHIMEATKSHIRIHLHPFISLLEVLVVQRVKNMTARCYYLKDKNLYFFLDHDNFGPPLNISAFRANDYGYSRMQVFNATHLYMEQVSDDQKGKVIDNFWIIKDKHGPY